MTDRDAWLERAMQRHETELLRLCYAGMPPEDADWGIVDDRLSQARAGAMRWLKEAVTAALPAQGAGAR